MPVLAALAAAAWLPFLHRPLTSDEAGFLLVGRSLHHGTSLYGDYWVDRPPLLLWLFRLAGSALGVALLGMAASALSVLLAGRLGGRLGAVVAAVLLASPALGMPETDGELLSLPFVLAGLIWLAKERTGAWAAAGAAGMAAALVKQSALDVFVFAVVLVAVTRPPARRVAAFAAGATATLAGVVAAAAAMGTTPGGLWDAVVLFRLDASRVIGASASPSTGDRLVRLADAALASGAAPLLLVAAALALTRPPRRLAWPALAMAGWEVAGVAAGGSYWLHYLTGLVPGLVVLSALAVKGRTGHRLLPALLAAAAVSTSMVWVHQLLTPAPASDGRVAAYLRSHAAPHDGVVVGFGHPDIVLASGLTSPYEQLWSLPVRVRDPRLTELRRVLRTEPPRWVVVDGASLGSWGIDATRADRELRARYRPTARLGEWRVWELDRTAR